jgi:hypothetical protein
LPRAALGKGFAEGLRGFAESLGPSAKQPAPVVRPASMETSSPVSGMARREDARVRV